MPERTLETIVDYLAHQDIIVSSIPHINYAVSGNPVEDKSVKWSKVGFISTENNPDNSEIMSLASMAAVEQLALSEEPVKLLDICAAPGMKSLYALLGRKNVSVYSNDISEDRLIRLKTIYKKHGVRAERITKCDGQRLGNIYEPESFDRIILDAPCSGEGVILGDDPAMLASWSPAKIKRLQQLQIRLLKEAWSLLKPNGRLVYATCTLNKNENERVIHKALHASLDVKETTLSPNDLPILESGQARRILPSKDSIGFFYAVLEKSAVTVQLNRDR